MLMFTDNTKLFSIIKNQKDIIINLQANLDKFNLWYNQILLLVNIDKFNTI